MYEGVEKVSGQLQAPAALLLGKVPTVCLSVCMYVCKCKRWAKIHSGLALRPSGSTVLHWSGCCLCRESNPDSAAIY
jgi:hypothetical protein